jgi:arginyl-tRNA synthetase
MKQTVRQLLKDKVSEAAGMPVEISISPDPKLGDYSTNAAFLVSKKGAQKNPVDAANALKGQIEADLSAQFDIQVAPNGFINFYARPEFLRYQLGEISRDLNYGQSDEGAGKKVIVEYSSPNIAKPMHIGHLRSTVIGDSLGRIYKKLGYDVVRWNYIGDWGTQFGKMLLAIKKYGRRPDGVLDMGSLYVQISKEIKENPELEESARAEFKKLEDGDEENRELWKLCMDSTIVSLKFIYEKLNISGFDVVKGESAYEAQLGDVIENLESKSLAKESEGALIVELENLPPMMLRKTDGATLYATRDIASLEDRITNYHPDKILYVVANQQALHFEQLFAVAKKLGWTDTELVHVKFGMVLGEDGKKLATREGKVVPLQEVIDKITELARETVQQKNSNLSPEEMERVAHVVAIGALKYNDLKQHPYSDIEFDWKAMLDLSGNSGPYIQYTYARLANILNKAGSFGEGDTAMLTEPSERMLMRQLLDYPEAIKESAERHALNNLALYLYDLAHRANQFYEQVHVLEDENTTRRNARLMLIKTVARTIKDGLALLGIETLERI